MGNKLKNGARAFGGGHLGGGFVPVDVFFGFFLLCIPLGAIAVPGAWAFLSPTKLSFLLLAAMVGITAGRKIIRLFRFSDMWLGVLVVAIFCSALSSEDAASGLGVWMRMVGMAALFVIGRAYFASQNGIALGMLLLAIAGAACSGLGLYQTLTSQTVFGLGIYGPYQSLVPVESLADPAQCLVFRAAGPFRHPNELGLFLCGCLMLSFGVFDRARRLFSRLLASLTIWLEAMTLVYTFSRSAWIGAGIGCVVFFVFSKRGKLFFVILVCAVALAVVLLPQTGRHALLQRSAQTQPYDTGRVASWRVAARMALNNPLLGVGPGAFAESFAAYKDADAKADVRQRNDAHNAFLSIAAEAGLPAAFAFGVLVLVSLAMGLKQFWVGRNDAVAQACFAALLAMMPIMLLNSFQYEELFWIALACNQSGGGERAGSAWIVRVPGRNPWRMALAVAAVAALALGAFYGKAHSVRDLAGRSLVVARTPLGNMASQRPRIYFDEAGLLRLRERARVAGAPEFDLLRDRADYLASQSISVCDTNDLRDLARSIPACALAYRMWGRPADLQQARARALGLAVRLDPAFAEDIESAEGIYSLALARDWLHEQFSGQEIEKMLGCIERNAKALERKIFYYPPAGNHRIVDSACLAVAGMACYGESPQAESWIRLGRRELERAAAFLGDDGLSPEGMAYASYSLEHLLKFHAAAEPLLGLALPAEQWIRAFSTAFIHQSIARDFWQPDNLVVSFADSPRRLWCGPGHIFAWLAATYREPLDQWLASRFLRNALDEGSGVWLYALWHQPAQPVRFPADLPPYRYSQDFGLFLARDSWSGRETFLGFTCRPPLSPRLQRGGFAEPGLGHAQPDANSWVLAHGADHLVTHPGPTTRKLTRLHNTILVNGRGQAGEGGEWLDAAAATAVTPAPHIVFAEHHELFDYVAGDASSAYPGSGLARFVRHVFWLRPGLLIVVDDLESKKTAVFDWLLHTEGRIISEGINVFLIKQGQSAMRLRFLEPSDLKTSVQTTQNEYADPEWGVRQWSVIQATPGTPKEREVFIAVITIAGNNAEPFIPVATIDATGVVVGNNAGQGVRVQTSPSVALRLAANEEKATNRH